MNKLFIPVAFMAMSLVACNNSQSEKPADTTPKTENNEVESKTEVKNETEAKKESQDITKEDAAATNNKELSSYEKLTKGNIKVNGTADIEGFCKAILPVVNKYYTYADNLKEIENEINKKSGYWSTFSEGDGWYKAECCYWNRTDKKKLVAFSERENYNDGDFYRPKSCLCFFLYNETTKELEPIKAPFNGTIDIKEGELLFASLPEMGKDIQYNVSKTLFSEDDPKILKWNGMGFDVK